MWVVFGYEVVWFQYYFFNGYFMGFYVEDGGWFFFEIIWIEVVIIGYGFICVFDKIFGYIISWIYVGQKFLQFDLIIGVVIMLLFWCLFIDND